MESAGRIGINDTVGMVPSRVSPPGRIAELDGLRAAAVAAVISFHYTLGTALANPVTRFGWAGVDLFFVLSGYLITSILLSSRGRPAYFSTFYARRTLRIFPVYFLLLALYLVAARAAGPQPWSYWAMHALFLSSLAEHYHFWMFPAPAFVYAGVTVLWTLSIEEMFYLLWAPVVRWLPPRRLWFVLAAAICGAPLVRAALHRPTFPEYRFLPARCDSLAWGAALALLLWQARGGLNLPRLRSRFAAAAAGLLLLLAVLLAATGGHRANLWFAVFGYSLLAALAAALIGWTVLSAGSRHPLCRLLRWRPAQSLGRISYCLYLIHYPLLLLVGAVIASVWARDCAALAFALTLAGASWRWFEAPILQIKDRWRPALARVGELPAIGLRNVQAGSSKVL
jgi:peptidoglycan/LPS O-acetylase OafA/YrhL